MIRKNRLTALTALQSLNESQDIESSDLLFGNLFKIMEIKTIWQTIQE